jgi:hypothetical protein
MVESKKFIRFGAKEGSKFLNYVKGKGQKWASWEYKPNCFLIWSNGILAKQEGEINYSFITGRGWVAY